MHAARARVVAPRLVPGDSLGRQPAKSFHVRVASGMSQNALLRLLFLLLFDVFGVGAALRAAVEVQVLEQLPQTLRRRRVMVSGA